MCVVYIDSVVEASSNGRIAVSKTVNEGSNPSASVESKSSEAIYYWALELFLLGFKCKPIFGLSFKS